MDVRLIPIPKAAGDEYSIPGGQCLIGRGRDCDLELASCLVSRHHAELFTDDEYDALRLRDLNSLNGTFVNGEETSGDCVLEDGDVVAFGMMSFEVRIDRPLLDRVRRRSGAARMSHVSVAADQRSGDSLI